jgi:lipopolysaccharide export LptBFGC system permease protein LptF
MTTLHAYVLRELLKNLALTLAAITGLVAMGGGLLNVVRDEGVDAGDLIRFFPLLVPIVATITLPVAALFAATMAYGRLAADNELVACRAAGINVHWLFMPAILLALFVAATSLLFGNFVVPGLTERISAAARNNLRNTIAHHLRQDGFVYHRAPRSVNPYTRDTQHGDSYTLTARHVQSVEAPALQEKGFETAPGLDYLLIREPAFLQLDENDDLVRVATARYGLCKFDTRVNPAQLTVYIHEGRNFDAGKRAIRVGDQQIGPFPLPAPRLFRVSMADLRALVRWRKAPWEVPSLKDDLRDFLNAVTQHAFYEESATRINAGATLQLRDLQDRPYHIRANHAQLEPTGLALVQARVQTPEYATQPAMRYEARRAALRVEATPFGHNLVSLTLLRTPAQDVLQYDPRDEASTPRRKPTISFDGLALPPEIVAATTRFTPADVLNLDREIPTDEHLADTRLSLQNAAAETTRKIAATLHFRLAYGASALVTILMGAALGVLFRGSRALSAFALAMVPFFCVLVLMFLGRQLSEDVDAHASGPFVTWGGLVLVLLADWLILQFGIRR